MMDAPDFRNLDRGNHRLPCPECNKSAKDTALSVTVQDDRSVVWVCFRCGWKGAARPDRPILTAVRSTPPAAAKKRDDDQAAKLDHVRAIWQQTVPLAGTLGADYLERRRCALPPADSDLRFHPALYCADVKAELPALVGKVTTVIGNRAIGIHRIWLRPGEARAVCKKRLGGAVNDAVCLRLWHDESVELCLGIAEGIETALAAARHFTPMWATIDAGQMAKFPILAGIESLTIFADYDLAGMKAATAAQERYFMAGRPAQIVRSHVVGQDYNDIVKAQA
jgi:putative DNA primase/helicase